jgi:L-rhamnose mutarotase
MKLLPSAPETRAESLRTTASHIFNMQFISIEVLLVVEEKVGPALTRYAQIIRLRPEDEAEYIRYHADVWPTVLQTIADCHIRNYSIFLRNGLLYAYFEYHGTDYAADMRKMAADPETQRWWTIMDPMQLPVEDAASDERWSQLTEVFHFGGPPVESAKP